MGGVLTQVQNRIGFGFLWEGFTASLMWRCRSKVARAAIVVNGALLRSKAIARRPESRPEWLKQIKGSFASVDLLFLLS
ncbi:hypothetical protein, partial [Pseudomonas kitaguniensis]|uniref:hypothetical protein n=1 Tax=Pseudomonas kitaguniensis TaxID=2607908 RepID=UPI0019D5B58D